MSESRLCGQDQVIESESTKDPVCKECHI
ncbi:hypothetical protein AVEN_11104-1, partial [Araneus ventricosus]